MNIECPSFALLGASDVGKSYYLVAAYHALSTIGFGSCKIRTDSVDDHQGMLNLYKWRVRARDELGSACVSNQVYRLALGDDFDKWEHRPLRTFRIIAVPGETLHLVGLAGEESKEVNSQILGTDGCLLFFQASQVVSDENSIVRQIQLLNSTLRWRLSKITDDQSDGRYRIRIGNDNFPVAVVISGCDSAQDRVKLHSSFGLGRIKEFVSVLDSQDRVSSRLFFTSAISGNAVKEPLLFIFSTYLTELQRQCPILVQKYKEMAEDSKRRADNGMARRFLRFLFGDDASFSPTDGEEVSKYTEWEFEDLYENAQGILNSIQREVLQ